MAMWSSHPIPFLQVASSHNPCISSVAPKASHRLVPFISTCYQCALPPGYPFFSSISLFFFKCLWFEFSGQPNMVSLTFFIVIWVSLTWLFGLFCEDGVEQVLDNNNFGAPKAKILKQKMELLGISLDNSCLPGQYHNLFCPKVSTFFFCSPKTVIQFVFCIYLVFKWFFFNLVCFFDILVQGWTVKGEEFVFSHYIWLVSILYLLW